MWNRNYCHSADGEAEVQNVWIWPCPRLYFKPWPGLGVKFKGHCPGLIVVIYLIQTMPPEEVKHLKLKKAIQLFWYASYYLEHYIFFCYTEESLCPSALLCNTIHMSKSTHWTTFEVLHSENLILYTEIPAETSLSIRSALKYQHKTVMSCQCQGERSPWFKGTLLFNHCTNS